MKKYRLKEEIRKLFKSHSPMLKAIMEKEDWERQYGIYYCDLEEVEERIELYWFNGNVNLRKRLGDSIVKPFTDEEKELCEKALNGELFTKDDMDEYLCFCDGKIKTVDEWLQHKQDEHVIGQSENYQER